MRKIIVQEMVSVDGFFAGKKGEIDWHRVDEEFNEYAISFLNTVDTFIFGRVTYDLMANYWPTSVGMKDNIVIAQMMNKHAKVVFSKTLEKAEWKNTEVFSEIDVEAIKLMKKLPGKDIAIFGSGTIVSALADLGLIDEYRFIISPIALGTGKTLFAKSKKKHELKPFSIRDFASGNISISYKAL